MPYNAGRFDGLWNTPTSPAPFDSVVFVLNDATDPTTETYVEGTIVDCPTFSYKTDIGDTTFWQPAVDDWLHYDPGTATYIRLADYAPAPDWIVIRVSDSHLAAPFYGVSCANGDIAPDAVVTIIADTGVTVAFEDPSSFYPDPWTDQINATYPLWEKGGLVASYVTRTDSGGYTGDPDNTAATYLLRPSEVTRFGEELVGHAGAFGVRPTLIAQAFWEPDLATGVIAGAAVARGVRRRARVVGRAVTGIPSV